MVGALQIMKTAHIQAAAVIQARSATRRITGGPAAGHIAHQAFTTMIHQPNGPHGAANWLPHIKRIALPHMRIVVTSVVARTMDPNATRRMCIGLGACHHVPLAFTTRKNRSTNHLGRAGSFIPMRATEAVLEVALAAAPLQVPEGGQVLLKALTFGIAMGSLAMPEHLNPGMNSSTKLPRSMRQ